MTTEPGELAGSNPEDVKPDRAARGVDRTLIAGLALGIAFVLLLGGWFMFERTDRRLDSNAVGLGATVASISKGDEFCINSVDVPSGTERLKMWLGGPQRPASFDLVVKSTGGSEASIRSPRIDYSDYRYLTLPETRWDASNIEQICLVGAEGTVDIAGSKTDLLPGEQPSTLNDKPITPNEPALHYFSGADDRPMHIAKIHDVFANSEALHGPVYPWLMLLSILLALAVSGWALHTLVTAERWTVKRIAVVFWVTCFAWCASWSIMSPPLQGNDEAEHYAHLEYLAMNGHGPDRDQGNSAPPYSSHEAALMSSVRHSSLVVDGFARPIWNPARTLQMDYAADGQSRSDGGGFTVSASGNSSLYYSLLAPFYRATTWMNPANQLVVLRIVNSAAAAFVAVFAVFAAALFFGGGRRLAVAVAGALVAFQPQFAYVSGAINNDTFANLAGAASLWLLLLLARQGWRSRREIALGLIAVIGPLGKITSIAGSLYIAAMLSLLILRERTKRAVRAGFTVLGTVIGACVVWLLFARLIGWSSALVYRHTNPAPGPPEWVPTFTEKIDYVIQQAFPFIELTGPMTQMTHPFGRIYVIGGFAELFWHRVVFPDKVYLLIAAVIGVVVLSGIAALWRYRRQVRENWFEVALVLVQPVVVYVFVEWAYATPGGRVPLAEQGRYIFPAIVALAIAASAAAYGLPRKLREFGWGGLVGLWFAFGLATWVFGAWHLYA